MKVDEKQDIYIVSKYLFKRHLLIIQREEYNFTVQKPRYHLNPQIKVKAPREQQTKAMSLQILSTEKDNIISTVFLQKMHELNLVKRKQQTNLNWGKCTKLAYSLQKCQGHKRQRKLVEHCSELKESKKKWNSQWWARLWTRKKKIFFFAIKDIMRTID